MAVPPLRCLQRLSGCCWWVVLPQPGLREASSAGPCRVVGPGPSVPSNRTIHNSSAWQPPRRAPSHYDVLKVTPHATQDEIKKAYYKMSLEHHPDLHGGSVEASEKFRHISEAYEVLGDPLKRSQYDAVHGVHARIFDDDDLQQSESIFRRPRRTGETRYNVRAWDEAHYGSGQQPPRPDWQHDPHSWWRTHGPRASPRDAMRFWDQEMARKQYGSKEATEQRRKMKARERELLKARRTVVMVMLFFLCFTTFVQIGFEDHEMRHASITYNDVGKK